MQRICSSLQVIMQNAIDGGSGNGVVKTNANQLASIYFILSQASFLSLHPQHSNRSH